MIHSLAPQFPALPIGVQLFRSDVYPGARPAPSPSARSPSPTASRFCSHPSSGFSCWFFMFLSRFELIAAATAGYTDSTHFPYVAQQGVGAIVGMFLTVAFSARRHLLAACRAALSPTHHKPQATDHEPRTTSHQPLATSHEAMSPRTAVFGLVAGAAGMVWFATAAGMRLTTAILFLGILFIIVIVVARLRAEIGLPTFELYQVGADQVMQRVAGTSAWNPNELSVMTLMFWMTRTHRQFPMQTHVDALRIGRRTNTSLRSVAILILLTSALGTVAAFWALLQTQATSSASGFRESRGPALWPSAATLVLPSTPGSPPPRSPTAAASAPRLWLPVHPLSAAECFAPAGPRLHPAGYLVAGSFGLFRLWLPIFVSWLLKALILRYGGLSGYRAALPFFIGLIAGEFAAGFLRTLLDLTFSLHLPPESGIGGL